MLDSIKKTGNITHTKNGAVAYSSTFEPCLDFFSVSGALRGTESERIIKLFSRAFASTPDYAVRALFYTRDVRGGLGERGVFRIILKWLAENVPETVIKNISLIPEYGRYDDIICLLDTPCHNSAIQYIKETLASDEENMREGRPVSLIAKWIPSLNASNPLRKRMAKVIAKSLGLTEKVYRKRTAALKRYIGILETKLCESDYTFDYEKQPSKALYKYRQAFMRNDGERYSKFINDVKSGEAVLKTNSLYPYEIIRNAIEPGLTKEEALVLDATWNSLPDYCDDRNAIAVIDGSASMIGTPLNIATSLGMYFAERNKGFFHNHFITFSQNPRLVEIRGETIRDKAMYCMSYNEVANTDLMRVYGLILKAAIDNNLPQSELPETIYVISDMEFDKGVCSDISLHDEVKNLFKHYGYTLPAVVYWNVNSHNAQYPVTQNEHGVALLSGASPVIFKMAVSRSVSPISFMLITLDSERYRDIYA